MNDKISIRRCGCQRAHDVFMVMELSYDFDTMVLFRFTEKGVGDGRMEGYKSGSNQPSKISPITASKTPCRHGNRTDTEIAIHLRRHG